MKQAPLQGDHNSLGPVVDVESVEDGAHPAFDGDFGDSKLRRDLLIALSLCYADEYIALSRIEFGAGSSRRQSSPYGRREECAS